MVEILWPLKAVQATFRAQRPLDARGQGVLRSATGLILSRWALRARTPSRVAMCGAPATGPSDTRRAS